jgi:hypothetical protein
MIRHLFVYGTLMPRYGRWPVLAPWVEGEERGSVTRPAGVGLRAGVGVNCGCLMISVMRGCSR